MRGVKSLPTAMFNNIGVEKIKWVTQFWSERNVILETRFMKGPQKTARGGDIRLYVSRANVQSTIFFGPEDAPRF